MSESSTTARASVQSAHFPGPSTMAAILAYAQSLHEDMGRLLSGVRGEAEQPPADLPDMLAYCTGRLGEVVDCMSRALETQSANNPPGQPSPVSVQVEHWAGPMTLTVESPLAAADAFNARMTSARAQLQLMVVALTEGGAAEAPARLARVIEGADVLLAEAESLAGVMSTRGAS